MRTWILRVFLMGCLLPAEGFAQQKPVEAPPADELVRSASAEQKPAEDQEPNIQLEPITWPEKYDPRTLKPIRLFMTREEVHETWGEPEKYVRGKVERKPLRVTKKYVSREEYAAGTDVHGEVYYRKVGSLPFEVQITYRWDMRDPEHLEMRPLDVQYRMSKPVPAFRLLQELPEAAELCRSGCGIYGDSYTEVPQFVVYPRIRTMSQRIEASRMAGLLMLKKGGRRLAWTPVLRLLLPKGFPDKEPKAQETDGFESPIEEIRLVLERPLLGGTLFKLERISP